MRQGRCEVLSSREAPASGLRESWYWKVRAGFKRRQHTHPATLRSFLGEERGRSSLGPAYPGKPAYDVRILSSPC